LSIRCPLRLALSAFAAGAALAPCSSAQDAASAQAAREWNQPRGDADLSASCDVEPIVRTPAEGWRIAFHSLYADPVCWGGVVFVAGLQQREPMLYAFDLETGKSVATATKLPGAQPGWLAVWQGFVAFVQPDGVQILSLRGGQFTSARKSVPVARPGPPSVLAGQLFVCDWRDTLHCIDLDQGKELGHFDGGQGQPALVALDGERRALVASVSYGRPEHPDPNMRYVGQFLALDLCEVHGLGTPSPTFGVRKTRYHAPFQREIEEQALAGSFPIALGTDAETREPGWMVFSTELLEGQGKKAMHVALFPKMLYDLGTPPVVVDGRAIGFSQAGDLVRANPDGSYSVIVQDREAAQKQRRASSATRARGVLYLENWALRLEDRRVLWELPELDLAHGLWPVGDGLALYTSAKNELVCLRDPGAQASPSPASTRKPEPAARKLPRPSLPGSGEGVVLRDGTRIAGAPARGADGSVELTPEHGATRHFAASELALVETTAHVERTGPEQGVYRAAWAACSLDYREALAPQIETYLQAGLVDEARALLNTLQAFGAEPGQIAALDKRLSGRVARTDRNAAGLHEGGRKEEARLCEKGSKRFLEAARWCRDHGLALSASVLYADALRVDPACAGVAQEVAALVPPGAPWHAQADAPARWMALAREILPAEGSVVAPDDEFWKRIAGTAWAADSIVLRSPNLELVSRDPDPRIVGRALRLGERAVEVLQHLLGEAQGSPARLELRLHRSKADYQEEQQHELGYVAEWMAGHYAPAENVSRFYVSREGGEADLRELERVLVHELSHHYIEARWAGAEKDALLARRGEPGFWIVEGLAEFVSGQVLELDRRGERFDDAEVLAVDATAQIEGERLLIPIARLVDLDQRAFWKLADAPLAGIQFQHTLGSTVVTERQIFYQESAALVFFLLNQAGQAHAAALPSYLRSWYRNGLQAESWQALGYSGPEELAAAFVAFLEERRKR
jgi:hypothetical protein